MHEKSIKIASLLKSVAHPIRIKVIRLIFENESLSVSQIYTLLNIDQPVVSLHLGILKKHGVINSKKEGKNSYYYIVNRSIIQIIEIISNDYHVN